MNILHTITGLHVGGAETMLAKLMEADSAGLFEPTVVSMMTPGRIAERIRASGVRVATLGMAEGRISPSALIRLARTTRDIRPDIIHGWMQHGALAASMAGWCLGTQVPVIWNIRHSLVDIALEKPMSRAVLRLERAMSRTPAAIIYNAHVSARQYEAFGFFAGRAAVIPNGFDCVRFQPCPGARGTLRRAFGIHDGPLVVAMIARHHPMKDPANLARAVAIARTGGHDIHLLMVGRGAKTPSSELRGALAALPADRVTLAGERHDIADWLPAVDMVSLPSAWGEGFPNIIGEAMACGLPCVATDVGDSRWIIDRHGTVVPPRDAEALGEALAEMASLSPAERRQLGAYARNRVLNHFSLPEIARQYDELHLDVIERHHGLTPFTTASVARAMS